MKIKLFSNEILNKAFKKLFFINNIKIKKTILIKNTAIKIPTSDGTDRSLSIFFIILNLLILILYHTYKKPVKFNGNKEQAFT
ncbi:MAG: hypothetical protein HGA36_04220 [Candidatus Moranbacteria bacterium]|nr:hypothetical protein [Candidatus Moranbacteria bacterium]